MVMLGSSIRSRHIRFRTRKYPKIPDFASATTNPEQSDCTESYSVAGEETFKAEPDPGYKYTGWNQGHCAGVGDCYVSWDETQATNFEGESRYTVGASFEPVNPTPQSVSYTYNALGQRVAKTANGITTFFIYDQYGNLISEVDQNGTVLREYVYFEGQRVAHIETSGPDAGVHYILNDHLGRPMQVYRDPTDPNNPSEMIWELEAESFGEETGLYQITHNHRFPGQYYEQETGLSYNYYRDYDPSLGRYIEVDPAGVIWGYNDIVLGQSLALGLPLQLSARIRNHLFGYTEQNPINKIDNFGLESSSSLPGVIGEGLAKLVPECYINTFRFWLDADQYLSACNGCCIGKSGLSIAAAADCRKDCEQAQGEVTAGTIGRACECEKGPDGFCYLIPDFKFDN